MGALTDSRKRRALEQRLLSPLSPDSPPPPSKKSRLVEPPPSHYIAMEPQLLQHRETHQSGFSFHPSSRPVAEAARDNPSFRPRFPPPALRRPIHAPQRILKAFGLGSRSGSDKSGFDREIPSYKKDTSTEGTSEKVESRGLKRDASFLSTQTGQNDEVVDLSGVDCDINTGSQMDILGSGLPCSTANTAASISCSTANTAASISEGTGEIVSSRGLEFKKRFSKSSKKASDSKSGFPNIPKKCLQSELGFSKVSRDTLNSEFELSENPEKVWGSELVSSVITSPEIERSTPSLEQYKKLVSSVSSRKVPLYKGLYDQSVRSHDSRLRDLEFEVKLAETSIANFKLLGEILDSKHEGSAELFTPLTDEEENEVKRVLNGRSSREILVAHEASNIEITREKMQCLRYGAWLNDEVINLYLELFKERERREPEKFLRCHFFNTFFYKKLAGGSNGYDFKAVKRWTTQRKLGYALIDCDKVFVPIHKEVHWCLAVINVRDKKLQYLDSLGGTDTTVLRTLARYFAEEVKEKNAKQIDTYSWNFEDCPDLPLQENGWDCGMFMLKYIDFLSRDLSLSFSQEHMLYFRKRTVKELLSLKAV